MGDGFWVFGYGSLIWHPGFDFDDKRLAVLHGWRRAFCMTSVVYRGTPEAPGLVLALDRDEGGHCLGVAYHVAPASSAATLAYLRERELVSYAYDEARVTLDARRRGGGGAGLCLEPGASAVPRRAEPRGPGRGDRRGRAGRGGRMPIIC